MQPKSSFDLGSLKWQVSGYVPHEWEFGRSLELGITAHPEVGPIPAPVPGSVQQALLQAGLLPDWNQGLNAKACEWVENRHWIYSVDLPDNCLRSGTACILRCQGLDGFGSVVLNNQTAGTFSNAFMPHEFNLSPLLKPAGNHLMVVFTCPPRWLGQFGATSQMKEWKPRFNYTWDWTPRLVQIGIWDSLSLEFSEGGPEFAEFRCLPGYSQKAKCGTLKLWGKLKNEAGAMCLRATLFSDRKEIAVQEVPVDQFRRGAKWQDLIVEPWWPHGEGKQPLYKLRCELLSTDGKVMDVAERTVGFKSVEWELCKNTPTGADPWICVVNGKPVFLQGIDWTPIRPNFADVHWREYDQRIKTYRSLGCNIFRVWGGAVLEKQCFYEFCDQHGILVWQEFPFSSSGADNSPPEDFKTLDEMTAVARSYVVRRQHHASLLLWCGGNELQTTQDGKPGCGRPLDLKHPMLRRFREVVDVEDPGRRFLPTSSSGPRFIADENEFGKGVHWDVHGPWKGPGNSRADWEKYWKRDDALFRSETGAPGASSADIIRRFCGGLPVTPGTIDNPLWRRNLWWIEWDAFIRELGREPKALEDYVDWSQQRQADALRLAVTACKKRFPQIGGVILWMGHDCFPCPANTSILDFYGNPKPAAKAVGEVFNKKPEEL